MIENIAYLFMVLSFMIFISLVVWIVYVKVNHIKRLKNIFDLMQGGILSTVQSKKKADFELKLVKAGITRKEFYEVVFGSIIAGIALIFLTFIIEFSSTMQIVIVIMAIGIMVFAPFLYLDEQIKARIKRIDNDLAIFLDLLIIILEGGGGLNNAIDRVTTDGEGVLGKDLLEESRKFKNEMIAYSSEVAYHNLAARTGSEAISAIVGFMKLSEETGIGVKTIFENQAEDIKAAEILAVEKKAASMNIGITLVMFIFIIPAVIAMIAFPVSSGSLMSGF
jgi:tight adherence protein C